MDALTAIREVQIPLLAAMLLGACAAKLVRTVRRAPLDDGHGPTVLFPASMRAPVAVLTCAAELALGVGLVLTAGRIGAGGPATAVRLATFILFGVFTSALIELRSAKPDVGCGCFGDFSTAPVSRRAMARSALLGLAAVATIDLQPIQAPGSVGAAVELAGILLAELLVIAALSPEIGEGLVRLGYTEPCELRDVPSQRTLAALRRSRQWRRSARLVTADAPVDMWRELCWRYVVYPGSYEGRQTDVVFAVYLQQRRPTIRVAMVDAATGETLEWPPSAAARPRLHSPLSVRLEPVGGGDLAVAPGTDV